MRRVLFIIALFAASPAFAAVDMPKMVETIRLVENSSRRGLAGERGPWQIMPSVWRQYSKKSLDWAESKRPECVAEQRRVAAAHIMWIRCVLIDAKMDDSPRNIALVWCAGLTKVVEGKPSAAKKDYAERAKNIYESLR